MLPINLCDEHLSCLLRVFLKVLAAEAEQLRVTAEIDDVYSEIASLRDEIRGGKDDVQAALGEILEVHSQCQQLEQHNTVLAGRLAKLQARTAINDLVLWSSLGFPLFA